jgi:hypothetical protein
MIQCKNCKCKSFRRTRLEFTDLLYLPLFRYRVRCRQCGIRTRVSLFEAFFSALPRGAPHLGTGAGQSWTDWTSTGNPAGPALHGKEREIENSNTK